MSSWSRVIYAGSEKVAPYLAARIAFARLGLRRGSRFSIGEHYLTWTSNGVTVNGGAGILVRLTPRANLDFGASAGFTTYKASEGQLDGSTFDVQLGSGTNLVVRMGLALGVGG